MSRNNIVMDETAKAFIKKFLTKEIKGNSRKQKCVETDSVSIYDYWSEGGRTDTWFYDKDTCQLLGDEAAGFTPQVEANPFRQRMGELNLKDYVVVLQKTTFRGQNLGFTLYVKSAEACGLTVVPKKENEC